MCRHFERDTSLACIVTVGLGFVAEIETLEKKLANKDVDLDVSYDKVPTTVEDVLTTNPTMHKGQLFFIKTFAEGLFKSILELFPELEFTSDIAMENKEYWLVREANLNG